MSDREIEGLHQFNGCLVKGCSKKKWCEMDWKVPMSWHELVVRMKSAVKKLGMRDSKNFGVQNESFKGE